MYNVDELVGKIVTIKLNNGIEIIARLTANPLDPYTAYVLQHPRTVVAAEKELALIPYLFTGEGKEVVISTMSVQTIVESLPESAKGYEDIIKEDK